MRLFAYRRGLSRWERRVVGDPMPHLDRPILSRAKRFGSLLLIGGLSGAMIGLVVGVGGSIYGMFFGSIIGLLQGLVFMMLFGWFLIRKEHERVICRLLFVPVLVGSSCIVLGWLLSMMQWIVGYRGDLADHMPRAMLFGYVLSTLAYFVAWMISLALPDVWPALPDHICQACGYDRTGLKLDRVCPECGALPDAASKSTVVRAS
ncbi:MAG: hypothetical protein AAGI17_00660 [Planctomycetota bacterium]